MRCARSRAPIRRRLVEDGFIGLRDPRASALLVLGRLGDAWILSSGLRLDIIGADLSARSSPARSLYRFARAT